MSKSTDIKDMERDDLAEYLIGRKIVEIDIHDNRITLDNGTILTLYAASECCAWFHANLYAFDFEDNMVTDVTQTEADTRSDNDDLMWTLHILSNHKTIADVNIHGDDGTGYYVQSVILEVTLP